MREAARPGKAAVEGRRIVDAHHHLYDLQAHYYPWLCDEPPPPWRFGDIQTVRRSYRIADYLADIDGSGIAKSVHVEVGWDPRDPAGETAWLQGVADQHGFPHAIVGAARLEEPGVAAILDRHASHANFRGIRQNLNWHADPAFRIADRPDYMTDPQWRRGFALLAARDLSFDLQIYPTQMEDAARLALDFPETRIILDHVGMPLDLASGTLAPWADGMACLAAAPNVAVKISGLGLADPHWSIESIRSVVLRTIDLFGPDRCMFASDFPMDGLFADLPTTYAAFEAITADLGAQDRDALFARTAERWYRI